MYNPYVKRGNKYGRKKTEYLGIMFDSKLEAKIYEHYKYLEMNGDIEELETQYTVILQDGNRKEKITLVVDFSWINPKTKQREYGEAKGQELPVWKLKLKLFRMLKLGKLEIWKGTYLKPILAEVIE